MQIWLKLTALYTIGLYTGWVHVSIRKEINTIYNIFSKNKYQINRQHELMI